MATRKLSRKQFCWVKTLLANAPLSSLNYLRTACFEKLQSLGVERDQSKATEVEINDTPESCSVDSVVRWVRRIGRKDRFAVRQLVEIDAIIVTRGCS